MSNQSIFDQVALPDPALIPARIIEGHRRENRTREGDGLIALIAYSIRVQMEPTPTDDMAFKDMLYNGLTSALITCMLDEHLCGFTKAELTSCQGGGLDLYLKNIVVRYGLATKSMSVVNYTFDSLISTDFFQASLR